MRTSWPAAVALALLAPLGLHSPPLHAQSTVAATSNARVIVKFKAGSALGLERAQAASAGAERAQTLGRRLGVALNAGAAVSDRAQVMSASGISSAELARRLAAQPEVEYAEPDVRHRRLAPPNDPRYATVPLVSGGPVAGQWYLKPPTGTLVSAINAETAWDTTTGSNTVVVAVLDTGIRFDHPDLLGAGVGNLLAGYDMISGDSAIALATANDGGGRDADPSDPGDWVSSADVATPNFSDCFVEDSSWHGTQTASLVGALTDNGIGMASVGRTVRVLPVRVLGKCGGFTSDIAAGIRWAAGATDICRTIDGQGNCTAFVPPPAVPAKVINMSLGGEGPCSNTYQQAINEVVAAGVVVVVSAGNSDGHAVSSPANCNGVIAVTALRHAGSKVGFADVGPQVAIAAPGGNCVDTTGLTCVYPIMTATNTGTTTPAASTYTDGANPAFGTSFSAPLVAGTVGLMMSVRPTMTVSEVRAALQGSARPFPATGGDPGTVACRAPDNTSQGECYCTTSTCGAGMLDTRAAVLAADRGLQARISQSSSTPRAAEALTLSAATSYVLPGRTIATYQWALVDGGGIVTSLGTTTGPTVTVTPSATGRFRVSVTVTDSTSAQSTSEQAIQVAAPALVSGGGGGGGGGGLGLVWLAGLALAVAALQLQRHRACPVRVSRHRR
jgi:serine protease